LWGSGTTVDFTPSSAAAVGAESSCGYLEERLTRLNVLVGENLADLRDGRTKKNCELVNFAAAESSRALS